MSSIRYAKHNRVFFRSSEAREEGIKMFNIFFERTETEEAREMKGHIIFKNTNDLHEAIVVTFWRTKDDMERFYSPQNFGLADLVERAKPLFEKMPERTDFSISGLYMTQ